MSTLHPSGRFKAGDILFHQGDASDRVLRLKSGEVEILREVGAAAVLLGRVKPGEWLGEMGVIENRVRSATARAATDGEAETLSAADFLDRVSADPALARGLILRLSIRLHTIEDRIAGDLAAFAPGRDATVIDAAARLSLGADSDALRARIGAARIAIGSLPFVVGRQPEEDESAPARRPDLVIADERPFRLSRQHFMIARSGGHLMLSDLGSVLGTIVNGQPIGHHFDKDAVPLRRGENHILAGGFGSPFAFSLTVD